VLAGATAARGRLATFAVDSEIRFATPADRGAFASELSDAVTALVGRDHDEAAPGGRRHRLVIALHPSPNPPSATSGSDAA
jgi:hypothetical protein